ncbi:unnamed protein product [Eruca vesicaria subsp. sativa]|uniref:Uncharacterized protein n=1 Tax=Eruca vesicaria subsp. sativa TaxID=29727 RepID=A0ABC8KBI9_ERUVS|nr:unnamed protein product [Eruca vesicaria subsp. sativa]
MSESERFPTLSTGIHLTGKWNPLLRSISTAGSRRRVDIVMGSTVDSDYSPKRSSSNEQTGSIMLLGCDTPLVLTLTSTLLLLFWKVFFCLLKRENWKR